MGLLPVAHYRVGSGLSTIVLVKEGKNRNDGALLAMQSRGAVGLGPVGVQLGVAPYWTSAESCPGVRVLLNLFHMPQAVVYLGKAAN